MEGGQGLLWLSKASARIHAGRDVVGGRARRSRKPSPTRGAPALRAVRSRDAQSTSRSAPDLGLRLPPTRNAVLARGLAGSERRTQSQDGSRTRPPAATANLPSHWPRRGLDGVRATELRRQRIRAHSHCRGCPPSGGRDRRRRGPARATGTDQPPHLSAAEQADHACSVNQQAPQIRERELPVAGHSTRAPSSLHHARRRSSGERRERYGLTVTVPFVLEH